MTRSKTLRSITKTDKRSLQKLLNIVITASNTIITANNFRPRLTESNQFAGVSKFTDTASQYININEGKVKPKNAAIPPANPAFCNPIANPIWLEPGPGKI